MADIDPASPTSSTADICTVERIRSRIRTVLDPNYQGGAGMEISWSVLKDSWNGDCAGQPSLELSCHLGPPLLNGGTHRSPGMISVIEPVS
jgi:hypothetical protein